MKKIIGLLITWLLGYCSLAQSTHQDLTLLEPPKVTQPEAVHSKSKSPITRFFLLGVKIYQHSISEQLATNCSFELTCSRFSRAMINEYGLIKGYFLTFDRLSQCNAISPLETFPVRLNKQGKIIEYVTDFRFN
ncbi:MAG: membrane protein insertion efficiency factor YidD [Bacteroidetes bacterium]|nr:membrane protein insertion efficiency factor YidD [Bacteroidota bacterium]